MFGLLEKINAVPARWQSRTLPYYWAGMAEQSLSHMMNWYRRTYSVADEESRSGLMDFSIPSRMETSIYSVAPVPNFEELKQQIINATHEKPFKKKECLRIRSGNFENQLGQQTQKCILNNFFYSLKIILNILVFPSYLQMPLFSYLFVIAFYWFGEICFIPHSKARKVKIFFEWSSSKIYWSFPKMFLDNVHGKINVFCMFRTLNSKGSEVISIY